MIAFSLSVATGMLGTAASAAGPHPASQPVSTVTGGVPVVYLTPPYQQNRSATGMVIMCELPQATPLRLAYGPTTNYGAVVDFQRERVADGAWICRALLAALDPDTTYHYRLCLTNGTPASADATFYTAATNDVDFCFGVWSDSQTGNGGDWNDPSEPARSMMRHMAASGVAFGLSAGDVVQSGTSYKDCRRFYLDNVARELGPVAPWYVAWGNHDTPGTNAPMRQASDMPSRHRPEFGPGNGSFAFTYANCFFVCIDHFDYAALRGTNAWVRRTLESDAARQARFRIIAIHAPPYCERWVDGSKALRDLLVPLMESNRVDICFSGHTHEYERGATNGVHYVVTGGASYLDYPERVVTDWPHMTAGGAHNLPGSKRRQSAPGVLGPPAAIVGGLVHEYCHATVRGRRLRLECRAFNADGSYIGVVDSFELQSKQDAPAP